MRIGFILDGNFRTDSRVINEAHILENHGHSIFVLTPSFEKNPAFDYFSDNIAIVNLPFSKQKSNYLFFFENLIPLYDYFWYREINRFVKEYDIEALHVHDLYLSKAAGRASRLLKLPLILDLHENYPAAVKEYRWATRFPARLIVRPGRWSRKEKKYLSFADKIIVLSSNFKNNLISKYQGISSDNIFIYPNVPDVKRMLSFSINRDTFQVKDKILLFYFGVISRRRGIMTALEALKATLPEHPELHLLLIGPIDKAERNWFLNLFNEDSVKDHITYYPWKDISEFPSYAGCSSICISPVIRNAQHDSGVANKIFQYMLFGKPLLVSDCIPQREIVENTRCGLIFKNDDQADMTLKLKQLISDPDELKRMGERGKKAVLEKYNTEIQGNAIIKAYDQLINSKS